VVPTAPSIPESGCFSVNARRHAWKRPADNLPYTGAEQSLVDTQVGNWVNAPLLSTDTILGNGDDIPLGFFPHTGVLNPGDSYSVTNMSRCPIGSAETITSLSMPMPERGE